MGKKAEAKVEGVAALKRQLTARQLTAKRDSKLAFEVGFTAEHAIYVHEDLEVFHRVGQAKYLETPLRRNRANYAKIVKYELGRGRSLRAALMAAGRRLLADARKLVPVDTGELRDSGFVRLIGG